MYIKDEGVDVNTLPAPLPFVNPFTSTKYEIAVDFVQLTISITIKNLDLTDHASYWCLFQDNVGGTNQGEEMDRVDVCITNPATLTLTNNLAGAPTTDHDDPIVDTDAVSGHPITFTCTATDALPQASFKWFIGTTEVFDANAGIAITTNHGAAAFDSTVDSTSTLTFTPQLNDGTGVVAFDDSLIKCEISQEFTASPAPLTQDSVQRLNVLVRPTICYFVVNNAPATSPVDVIRDASVTLTAFVENHRDASSITFSTTVQPSPADNLVIGTGDSAADGVQILLVDAFRDYTFTVRDSNDGNTLAFTADNNALNLAGDPALSPCEIEFNVVDGPTSSIDYNDPVTGVANGPIDTIHTDCATNKIEFLQGADLTITCSSLDVNPAATITVYQGDGPANGVGDGGTNGDFLLATSGAGDQTAIGGGSFNTVFAYTLVAGSGTNQFDINDDGDVITCCATNSVGVTYSSACLEVLVQPSGLILYEGLTSGDTAESTETRNEGEPIEFTCVAEDANPAAGIFWRLPSRGGSDLTEASETPVQQGNVFDTTSVLSSTTYSYQASDCNQVLTCTTVHTESGNTNPLSDSVTLEVVVPPDMVTLEIVAPPVNADDGPASLSGSTVAFTSDQDVGSQTICVIHGRDYQLTGTTNEEDPDADFTWVRRTTAGVLEATIRTYTAPDNTVTCSLQSTSDTLILNDIDCDTYDGKRICVEADNEHPDAAVMDCVDLDVKAEVQSAIWKSLCLCWWCSERVGGEYAY
ncbi:uncharacterized protein [Amphiura filiformis]|uniref:uncharacterized protein n=1 Tax=Amphiura filiformis TaxID=82378 RepID=UPI003B2162BF